MIPDWQPWPHPPWTDDDNARVEAEAAAWQAAHDAKPKPTLISAALWYGQLGLQVFPLQPRSKIPPKGLHWRQEATTNPDTIRNWWAATPDANIGLATGTHVDVIDVDGEVGVASWVRLIDSGTLPATLGKVSTPRPGGTHLYVRADESRANRAGLFPGIDIRATGGFVVAPPSVNDQGIYTWRQPLDLGGT